MAHHASAPLFVNEVFVPRRGTPVRSLRRMAPPKGLPSAAVTPGPPALPGGNSPTACHIHSVSPFPLFPWFRPRLPVTPFRLCSGTDMNGPDRRFNRECQRTLESLHDCLADCQNLLRFTSDGAELLVKAAMKKRGVPTDHTHDISRLADAFAEARPEKTESTQRMFRLNGRNRSHHMAMYDACFSCGDYRTALTRLTGTLDL